MAKAVAAAAAFLSAPASAGYATPFSPDPEIGEVGSIRARLLSNNFQTDPPQARPAMRHPWAVGLDAAVASRLSVEGVLSDGVGIGIKALLCREADGPLDLGLGFDELLHSTDRTLFGVPDTELASSGRVWLGAAQTWEFVRARAAVSTEPTRSSWNVVPWFGMETAFRLPFSLGWEGRFEDGYFRQSVGASLRWGRFRIAGGLSEFQSWILREWSFGWHSQPPPGALEGRRNPGWWAAISLDVPGAPSRVQEPPAPPPSPSPRRDSAAVRADTARDSARSARGADRPAPSSAVADSQSLRRIGDVVDDRLLHRDLAELAVRSRSDSVAEPLAMSILRRRILAGGEGARAALWSVGRDTSAPLDERIQAIVTLSDVVRPSDSTILESLARDPAPRLRLESAVALKRTGAASGRKALETLALDPEDSVRESAKALLKPSER